MADIRFILKKAIIYQNKKYKNALSFIEKKKVYLLQKNITIKKLSDKLNFKKLRLYRIIK